jgi:Asp-tRNA(Asn)/Glu-tRNA(Gln) amidotransferase A subunit family amidase
VSAAPRPVRTALDDGPAPTARAIAAEVASGERSAAEVAEATLAMIAAHEPDLRAFEAFDPALVRAQAARLDAARSAGEPLGPLHGVPFAVKDIADTFDQPTGYGSPIYAGHRPGRDAVVVERMRRAGALIVGKTVTTEFACFSPGATRNPHDLDRTPGGSSSGSAALVGAGIVPLALATQTAGSIIRPAAFCGAVGVKPTFGQVPREGLLHISPSLDTIGIIAADVRDAALALEVMTGDPHRFDPDGSDVAAVATAPLRIGWWPGVAPLELDPGIAPLMRATVDAFDDAHGIALEDVALPGWFGDLIEAQITIMRTETARHLAWEVREHPELVSERMHAFLAPGPDPEGVRRGLRLRDRALGVLDDVFARYDAIVTPAAAGEPPLADTTGDPAFCRIWTLLGTPAVTLPGLRGPDGLPLGVQLVGPRDDDARLLAVAARVADAMRSAGLRLR